MLLAPLTAVVPALAAVTVCLAAALVGVPPFATGALAVGVVALTSRGLHLDGLADTADGLAASYDQERALAVMRSGDVGPAGAATLIVVSLTQAACVAALVGPWRGAVTVGIAVIVSRTVLAMCCATGVPAARPTGLGATVAGSVPVRAVVTAILSTALVTALVVLSLGQPWWRGLLADALAFTAAGLLLRRCVRRLGGVTGDVLGACVEVALTAALVVLAARP